MRMVTLNVDDDVYRAYQAHAARIGRSAADLVREAMAAYFEREMRATTSIFDAAPHRSGGMIRPYPDADDDLLDEMMS